MVLHYTCIPKPHKIVGYDSLIRGSDPQNSRFLDPQVMTLYRSMEEGYDELVANPKP